MNKLLYQTRVLLLASVLFVSCTALPEQEGSAKLYSIEEAMKIVAVENDVTRTLYTKAIVGAGQKQGMKFDENWEKNDVEAGPLPALFLRGISADIQKRGEVPLGLFLGSDFPVRESNKFAGKQAELFSAMRNDKEPKFFYDEANQLQTAMFPDFAVAKPCVECHNKHPETKKNDWAMGDLMGATTWTYPEDSLTFEDLQSIILAYRKGVASTYDLFLEEVKSFKGQAVPEIGDKWPGAGYYLPSTDAFVDSVSLLASAKTLKGILKE